MVRTCCCRGKAGALLVVGLALCWGWSASPAKAAQKSDSVIKVTATAEKPDSEGKQIVTVTLNIDKGYHAYANPIGPKDFPGVATQVSVKSDNKPLDAKVAYPKGSVVKEKDGNYYIYENKAVIKATVFRAKGDSNPLEVSVKIQACTFKTCLEPSNVKLTVK